METLQLLGIALGLASLAGFNLYLVVFATGLAIRLEWMHLAPQFASLDVLANPVILGIAGVMMIAEFVADKVPWFDSVWDSVHTSIRPVGAALLAVGAFGDHHSVVEVAIALVAGTAALATHGLKAGTRLVINASPEPFSNWGLSLAGDALVLGGLGLIAFHPIAGLVIFLAAILLLIFVLPKVIRKARTRFRFAWGKLNAPISGQDTQWPLNSIPISVECELHRIHPSVCDVDWALPCVSRKGGVLRADISGWLIWVSGEGGPAMYFGTKALLHSSCVVVLSGSRPTAEFKAGFLYDTLVLRSQDGRVVASVMLDRQRREAVQKAVASLSAPQELEADLVSSSSEEV